MASVCIPCGVRHTRRQLSGDAITAQIGECAICGERTRHVVSASNYAIPDEAVATLRSRPLKATGDE